MDFATRAYNHSFKFDPIVRSLMDTDVYKFLMGNFIHQNYPNVSVEFSLKNRTTSVRLADEIDINELREQLDHCRSLRFKPNELIWLTGQTFYGQTGIFHKGYIDYLRTFKLPEYELIVEDGQISLRSEALWNESSMWEIPFLTVVNEMHYRGKMRNMSKSQLDITYARAKVKLYEKLERLRNLDDLNLSDFGTRRRHSYLWQEHAVLTAVEVLGDKFSGTSNCLIAMNHGLEAKGTNAHEQPMVLAALAKSDEELKESQYKVCQQWQNTYRGNLLVCLPDTFGTTQFLKDAPVWMDQWVGFRPDSKKAFEGGDELIRFWEDRAIDPRKKLILFSDGLDVTLPGSKPNGEDIVEIYNYFNGRSRIGFGFGTNFTNDFRNCAPNIDMSPISLVAKVTKANGHPSVKLSDNYEKASSNSKDEIARYRRVFGTAGMENAPVSV